MNRSLLCLFLAFTCSLLLHHQHRSEEEKKSGRSISSYDSQDVGASLARAISCSGTWDPRVDIKVVKIMSWLVKSYTYIYNVQNWVKNLKTSKLDQTRLNSINLVNSDRVYEFDKNKNINWLHLWNKDQCSLVMM
jgi:hypothetical protein